MRTQEYPRLAEFIGGWFHQDFDIEGASMVDVVRNFQAVTPRNEQFALREEIRAFLDAHPEKIDDDFVRIFSPDIIPSAFCGSTRAFLQEILENLPSSS